jgi:hypothetical protein
MNAEVLSPKEAFQEYVSCLERFDAEALAEHYNLPSLFIGDQGVMLLSDQASRQATATGVVEQAREQDYLRTEFPVLVVRRLSALLAQVSGVGVRLNTQEVEVQRFGFTHTMRLDGDTWRLVVVSGHEPEPDVVVQEA